MLIEDKRRWRRAYVRLWEDPDFIRLLDGEKVMATYVLLGPQTNRIGLYRMSPGLGIEHLRWTVRLFRLRLEKVCRIFNWQFDAAVNVVWIPSWWDYNPPSKNEDNMKGALTDLAAVPPTPLIESFARHLVYVPQELHPYFACVLDRYVKRPVVDQWSTSAEPQKKEKKKHAERSTEESAEMSSAPVSPSVMTFPTVGPVAAWALTEAQLAKWQGLYPALDVLGECRKAWDWCDTHPRKRKTAGGMPAFLSRWLMRTVDQGRGRNGGYEGPTMSKATASVVDALKRDVTYE